MEPLAVDVPAEFVLCTCTIVHVRIRTKLRPQCAFKRHESYAYILPHHVNKLACTPTAICCCQGTARVADNEAWVLLRTYKYVYTGRVSSCQTWRGYSRVGASQTAPRCRLSPSKCLATAGSHSKPQQQPKAEPLSRSLPQQPHRPHLASNPRKPCSAHHHSLLSSLLCIRHELAWDWL